MKKLLFWMVLICSVAVILTSCSKDETDDDSTTTSDTTAAAGSITVGSETLSGAYAGACHSGSLVDTFTAAGYYPSDTKAIRAFIVVTGDAAFSDEQYFYSDTSCSTVTLYTKDGNTSVTVGDASGSNYKVTYTESTVKIMANSTVAKTFYDAAYAAAGLSIVLTVGVELSAQGNGSSYKNLWLVTSTTIQPGSESTSTYPSELGSTTYEKPFW